MTQSLRKFILSVHVIFSVGWLGALVGYLVLVISGLSSEDEQIIRSVYIASDLIGWVVILPACLGSLLTGFIQSLGTSWGLFKYYWVLIKFLLTFGSTFLLVLHMQQISQIAELASKIPLPSVEIREEGNSLLFKASFALFILLLNTALSVYKPLGLTRYGLRKQQEKNKATMNRESAKGKNLGKYFLLAIIILLLLFIIRHLAGGGFGGH